jgi:hypothetical protein
VKHPLEQLLDGCLAQLNTGADLEGVLAAHPEVADELRPLLATAVTAQENIPAPVMKSARKDAFLASVAAQRRTVETVDGLVVELRAGVPLDELLESAPEALRPVVQAAWRMHTTPPPVPDAARRAADKDALVALAARRRQARLAATPRAWPARAWLGTSEALARVRWPRRAWSGALGSSLAMLVLLAGVAGVGSASASSLPGEPFYEMKRLGETAQLLFAFDPARRAELNLQFSERRLAEMRRLSEHQREVPIAVVEDWLRAQSNAWADIQGLPPAQRQALVGLLVALVGDSQAIEGRLARLVSDRAALESLLAQSAGLVRSARGAAVERPAPVVVPEVDLVPPARARPEVPAEQPADVPAPAPAQGVAPVIAAPPQDVAPPPEEQAPPPVLAPVAEEQEDGDDRPGPVAGPGQPSPAAPTAGPAAPPIIVPPLEDPNAPPAPDPGGEAPAP